MILNYLLSSFIFSFLLSYTIDYFSILLLFFVFLDGPRDNVRPLILSGSTLSTRYGPSGGSIVEEYKGTKCDESEELT
jgi:hypothetical protein